MRSRESKSGTAKLEDYDLISVSTHRRFGLGRALLGSITTILSNMLIPDTSRTTTKGGG